MVDPVESRNGGGPLVLKIEREKGGVEVRHFPADKESLYLGRSLDNDIVLWDRLASRRHARIERDDQGLCLFIDLGSQNGSRINGALVSRQLLARGDQIRLGECRIAVDRAGDVASAETAPEQTFSRQPPPSREGLLALIEINRAINAELNLEKLFTLVVDSALELTGGERCMLLSWVDDHLECKVARGDDGHDLPPEQSRYSRRLAEGVRQTGEPRLAADAQDEEEFKDIQSVVDLGVRSILCVPLLARGEIQGVLYVDHHLQTNAFVEADLELLEAFADQAGMAWTNAGLYQDALKRKEELEASAREVVRLNGMLEEKLARQSMELVNARQEIRHTRSSGYGGIIGCSTAMKRVFSLIDRYGQTNDPILIEGESGTGKELVARALHRTGQRSQGPFVSENCAAIPLPLLESELFGYKKGAFTGARKDKDGLFVAATGGLLFLDEVGEMSLEIQKKLLRVLEEKEVRPLGANKTTTVDVQVLAATNRPLAELVGAGKFREDLYYRLNVLPLPLPPLRERKGDIPLLVDFFLNKFAQANECQRPLVSPRAVEALANCPWPGNVRQLENELKRAMLMAEGEIHLASLSPPVRQQKTISETTSFKKVDPELPLPERLYQFQLQEILRVLDETRGNQSETARLLGLSRFTVKRVLKKHYGESDDPEDEGGED